MNETIIKAALIIKVDASDTNTYKIIVGLHQILAAHNTILDMQEMADRVDAEYLLGHEWEPADLLEDFKALPSVVKLILCQFGTDVEWMPVDKASKIIKDLESIGYTCELGMDGVLFGLTKLEVEA